MSGATRERFETHARNKNRGVLSGFSDGAYHDPEDQSNWLTWQAATADMDELLGALREVMNLTDQGREGGLILSRADREPITNGDQDIIDHAYLRADRVLARYGKS